MTAYYNEIDHFAAQWLRELIKAGLIAPGYVDQRSIEDVKPTELMGYTQCHFFAGIGVWSYALRQAGWPDDRPVWTGSCPCQPFSAAGAGAGFTDQRHLWPAFYHLISQRKPAEILGEQVASKYADPWVDLVQDDLEALDYAFGAVAFPSAGVGAPHIRDRTYWVAHSTCKGSQEQRREWFKSKGFTKDSATLRLAYAKCQQCKECLSGLGKSDCQKGCGSSVESAGFLLPFGLGNSNSNRAGGNSGAISSQKDGKGERNSSDDAGASSEVVTAGPTNGYWANADWLGCRDGRFRPVEPGTFPLVNGAAGRVGRLRGYGNAINAEAATQFIKAYLEQEQIA